MPPAPRRARARRRACGNSNRSENFLRGNFTMQSTLERQDQARDPDLHVAIIMDGNGRWAQRRGLPRVAGHREGIEAVRRTVEAAPDLGIGTLTLFAFSADN